MTKRLNATDLIATQSVDRVSDFLECESMGLLPYLLLVEGVALQAMAPRLSGLACRVGAFPYFKPNPVVRRR